MKKSSIVTKLNLPKIADFIIKIISENQSKTILIEGDLGAGKTTLTKLICKELGYNKNISSPTFVITKIYKIKTCCIVHYDLYRLSTLREFLEIGFLETVKDKNNIVIIEWPNKIKNIETLLKENSIKFIKIVLEHIDKELKRKITIYYDK